MLDPIEFIRMVRDGNHHHKDHPDEPCLCNENAAAKFLVEWEAAEQCVQRTDGTCPHTYVYPSTGKCRKCGEVVETISR